ncbi:NUDIX domain-containing protein [Microbacterium sp. Leaf320]|uniref:NUDIX domain-containing protein n=1 Tax=Microbacterium sp. Leaf320 TaxID=1736334 RepID=UPI0006FD23D7|nr:NUDIX hydrolase [Microbacterium sp. Leaf320]KQQ64490.1 NTP pyrophosphohydrolase [Microbacterium sp. Leaf320]
MTVVPPAAGEPRRPDGPRNPGDAWVIAPSGEKYWGRFGAAGLLAVDPGRGILLQHRVSWSHFGGTWGLPGGALHAGESAIVGAVREAQEEAGVPDGSVRPRFTSVLDLDVWSYTTVIADVVRPFEPVISDPESVALEWVPVDEVDSRPLHPGFGSAWPVLRELLGVRPALVVDSANVVGSVPDGWWKDRAGAATRLASRLDGLAVSASDLGLGGTTWFPEIALVVEGQARGIATPSSDAAAEAPELLPAGGVSIVRAEAAGDDAIVAEVEHRVHAGQHVVAVASDHELRGRVEAAGAAQIHSAGWLLDVLPQ